MAVTLFKEVRYTLNKLLEDIAMGEIGLPDIQRPFVWSNTKVRDLFDSMYRGYPVGFLLFWANGVPRSHRQIGEDAKQVAPDLMVVDGQQRLTSLYAVLKGIPIVRKDFRRERIYIAFRPVDETFEVADAAIRRNPEWIPDISILWSDGMALSAFRKSFLERLRSNREVTDEEEEQIEQAINNLDNLHRNYPFTALELSSTVDEEQIAEVFVRVNSRGTRLNQADFILTLMSVFWDEGRKELEEFCRKSRQPSVGAAGPYTPYFQPEPNQLLRATVALGFRRSRLQHTYSLLRGKDLQTGEFSPERRDAQFQRLREAQDEVLHLQNWHEFFKAVVRAGFRRGNLIPSQTALVYAYAFYLIGKRDFGLDPVTLRRVISRWFFFISLTGRYTGSFETRMEEDMAEFRRIDDASQFVDLLDRTIATTLTGDYWEISLPGELVSSAARHPALFAYYAALVKVDARVLFSDMGVAELLDPTVSPTKASLERHHLFPKGHLERVGIRDRRDVNQIANYALMEWTDNIRVSDAHPATYVPELSERFTPEALKDMYAWHALPDDWETMNYRDFLEERRSRMAWVIRQGFETL